MPSNEYFDNEQGMIFFNSW